MNFKNKQTTTKHRQKDKKLRKLEKLKRIKKNKINNYKTD